MLYIYTHTHVNATSAPAELGGGIHKVSRNGPRMQVRPQVRQLHVYGSGTFGAFWSWCFCGLNQTRIDSDMVTKRIAKLPVLDTWCLLDQRSLTADSHH